MSPKSLCTIRPTQVCTNFSLVTVQYKTITWISSNIKQLCIYTVQYQTNTLIYQVLVIHSTSSNIDVYYKLSYVTLYNEALCTAFLSFACLLVWCCITRFQQYCSYIMASVWLVEETGGHRENHRPVASHCQTWPTNAMRLALIEIRTHNIGDDRHWLKR